MPRLVVFELHHLGDAVMALPFLRAAESRYEITIVCHPPVANLLRQATNNIQILEAPSSWLALAKMARDLRLTTTDAAACVWADARAHLLMLLSGAGVRAGFPMTRGNYYGANIPWRKRRLLFGKFLTTTTARLANSPLLTHPLHRKTSSQSHLDDWTQLTQSLGFEPDLTLPWITHREHHLLGPITEFLNKQTGRPVVVVHPGGRLTTKRWPYFQALLQTLAAGSDPAVLIVQPPGEEAPHPCSERQILTPTTDIPSLMALFHIVDAAICNDSFASHLAAAMGKPVVTIFGSGNPDWFAPFQNTENVVSTNACSFRPCIDRCVMPSVICLESVTVGMVESRLHRVLNAG